MEKFFVNNLTELAVMLVFDRLLLDSLYFKEEI